MRIVALAALMAAALSTRGLAEGDAAAGRAIYAETCSGCHAEDGSGGREGGVAVPAIDPVTLGFPRIVRPARPAYNEAILGRSLAAGTDPAGRRLTPPMPPVEFSPQRLADLLAYLALLGTINDPGVEPAEIRIGAILPMTGQGGYGGQSVAAAIEVAFAAAGPIFGRTLHLQVEDAGQDIAGAYSRLDRRVFALVATLLPNASVDLPVVGPLDSTVGTSSAAVFQLQATLDDQIRVLVAALAQEHPNTRLATIGSGSADAISDAVRRGGGEMSDLPHADTLIVLPGRFADLLLQTIPDSVLVGSRMQDWLPNAVSPGRLRLVTPVASNNPAVLGTAAAEILIEGLKRVGARPTRSRLVSALETVRGFQVEGLPPESFGRGRHIGTRSSLIVVPGGSDRRAWSEPRE